MFVAVLFGGLIGLVLGLLGAGGSILAVPALVYGVGQPVHTAIAASLVVVALGAIGGLAPRERRDAVRWRVAAVFGAAGIPATFAGAALGRLVDQQWLLLTFAGLMLVVAIQMLRGADERGLPHP